MKSRYTYFVQIGSVLLIAAWAVFLDGCKKDFSRHAAVITGSVDKPSATANGRLIDLGKIEISEHGFCWDTLGTPSIGASNLKLGKIAQVGDFSGQLTGLRPSKVYYLRTFVSYSNDDVIYGDMISFTTPDLPNVITSAITEITKVSAVSGGTIVTDGGSSVIARGVCWSTSPNPDLSGNHSIDGTGTGMFIYTINELSDGTKYYVRAYATNYYGTRYGDQVAFTAGQSGAIPILTTTDVTNIEITTAISGGEVTSDGGYAVTARGICWSTNQNPTTSDSKTNDGSGTGKFSSSASGLTANTTYYLRAYAINETGTGYGEQKSFITKSNPVEPTVITAAITNITATSAVSGGTVTDNGGAPVTARGICWSTSENPTIGNSHTNDGSGTGEFVSSLTGLTPGTTYYIRAYATNSAGTNYGNQLNFITLSVFTCGSSFTINHVAGSVAPITKTVTYGTVTNVPGETAKCWITSNLGADHQAVAVDDATEASAGWYWQFNRKQGYKHDGTTRTPNTTWITSIDENLEWQPTNDPCALELGVDWRIPTYSEWTNVDASGNWTTWTGPWNSNLKLHAAGYLEYSDGSLYVRGSNGHYWSGTQYSSTGGWRLGFFSGDCNIYGSSKAYGFSVRCVKE